ncbi:hypothetical protein HR060_04120 [Catenovulum sp. SM1970]|uniref:hypothetical protein n=1 Tax=Marinifaba aquimaris TaxID=2741323 RepID=UPI00157343CE|nr:hypothetical protein [Marinifaba aquimaris]NTS76046.1 hypothetical protein [Marinifaba aquimaris]
MQTLNAKPYYLALAIINLIVIATFITAGQLQGDALIFFIKEGGLIESLSAYGYLIVVAYMLFKGGLAYVEKYWYFVVVLLSFSARELDFDKRFTEVGVLKSKFLVSTDVSITAKIIGFSIVLLVLFALFKIARNYTKLFFSRVFKFPVIELSVGCAGAFLVISKTLDGLARKLSSLDIFISKDADTLASLIEESMELGVPYLLLVATCYFFAQQALKNQQNSSAD